MVQVLKLVKTAGKLFVTLTIIFTFSIFLNGSLSRPRINKFKIWKIQYDGHSRSTKKSHDRKYILIWSKADNQFDILKEKQIAFKENKCAYTNCYVTADKHLLEFDYRNFDAILINGKTIAVENNATLPEYRLPHQMFIFGTKESADNYPICNNKYDNYFNLTWTYRLDSEAIWTYFSIYDNKDEEVGPKIDMKWSSVYFPVEEREILLNKLHAAAWFASNCFTNSKRELLVNNIKTNLKKYGLHIHRVGSCGTRECPIEKDEECLKTLEKYYFYFAFENSIAEDYVTEKVLKPLFHGSVPVVFGGANYSRFLPPHSYLDAGQLGADDTAATIAYLIQNRTAYLEYFRWQNNYRYSPSTSSVCNLCEVLNKDIGKIYQNFREWWNPHYGRACQGRHRRSVRNPRSVINAVWKRLTMLRATPSWYIRTFTNTTMNPRKILFK